MIAALSLSAWRARGRRRFCAFLAAFAMGFHVLAMAPPHQPAVAASSPLDDPHAFCLSGGDAPVAPTGDSGAPQHHQMPQCPICQSLQAAVPPPHAPAIALSLWALTSPAAPPAVAPPPPRLVLTDLNPRGPPAIG